MSHYSLLLHILALLFKVMGLSAEIAVAFLNSGPFMQRSRPTTICIHRHNIITLIFLRVSAQPWTCDHECTQQDGWHVVGSWVWVHKIGTTAEPFQSYGHVSILPILQGMDWWMLQKCTYILGHAPTPRRCGADPAVSPQCTGSTAEGCCPHQKAQPALPFGHSREAQGGLLLPSFICS